MAYGNWGAFVYKNGERQTNREDNTLYSEDEIIAGYWQAFCGYDDNGKRVLTGKELYCCHASLGNGRVRLCGYKDYPILYLDMKEVPLYVYDIGEKSFSEEDDWYFSDSEGIEGEIEGYKFKAWSGESSVHLELVEPDGTKWTGESGYCMGSGHEE